MRSYLKLSSVLVGMAMGTASTVSLAQVNPIAQEIHLKPFPDEIMKSDLDTLSNCGLMETRDNLRKTVTDKSNVGFSLICVLFANNQPKIWYTRIAEDGSYRQSHFLDQILRTLEYVYQDGQILGLSAAKVPAMILLDAQGKMVWQYDINLPNLSGVEVAEIDDGYVIAYYSTDTLNQPGSNGENSNVLTVRLDKISRTGKKIWSQELKKQLADKDGLFGGFNNPVEIWDLQNSAFAVSVATGSFDQNGQPTAAAYEETYYDASGKIQSQQQFDLEGVAAQTEQKFAVDPAGNVLFLGFTATRQADWQIPYQAELSVLDMYGKLQWQRQIPVDLPPETRKGVEAGCMIWAISRDPQSNYTVFCEQRYGDEKTWFLGRDYHQLNVFQFNKQGQQISKTTIFQGKPVLENLFSDNEAKPEHRAVFFPVFQNGQLLVGLMKLTPPLTKKDIEELIISKDPAAIGKRLGLKIYQIPLSKK